MATSTRLSSFQKAAQALLEDQKALPNNVCDFIGRLQQVDQNLPGYIISNPFERKRYEQAVADEIIWQLQREKLIAEQFTNLLLIPALNRREEKLAKSLAKQCELQTAIDKLPENTSLVKIKSLKALSLVAWIPGMIKAAIPFLNIACIALFTTPLALLFTPLIPATLIAPELIPLVMLVVLVTLTVTLVALNLAATALNNFSKKLLRNNHQRTEKLDKLKDKLRKQEKREQQEKLSIRILERVKAKLSSAEDIDNEKSEPTEDKNQSNTSFLCSFHQNDSKVSEQQPKKQDNAINDSLSPLHKYCSKSMN